MKKDCSHGSSDLDGTECQRHCIMFVVTGTVKTKVCNVKHLCYKKKKKNLSNFGSLAPFLCLVL